jgi:hypothetical protein
MKRRPFGSIIQRPAVRQDASATGATIEGGSRSICRGWRDPLRRTMVKSTSSSDGEHPAPEPPVGYPSAHVVQEMRRIFRVFVEPPNRFHPADVWGAMFWSRLELCGDFMVRGRPIGIDDRTSAIIEACKFWVNESRAEMVAAGYWPRLEVPALMALGGAAEFPGREWGGTQEDARRLHAQAGR